MAAATSASAAAPEDKVTLCHMPGTADEATITVSESSVAKHLAHGDSRGPCTTDEIIDADGILTAGSGDPGAREVQPGDALTTFPVTGTPDAGLDMFDQDGNGLWTQGVDDLHSEDPATCATAIRDGFHQLGFDCKVLDLNGDLADGEQVDCDTLSRGPAMLLRSLLQSAECAGEEDERVFAGRDVEFVDARDDDRVVAGGVFGDDLTFE